MGQEQEQEQEQEWRASGVDSVNGVIIILLFQF